MQTRREALKNALLMPVAAAGGGWRGGLEIIAEADCLSEESARGFAMAAPPRVSAVVVCAAHRFASELLERARAGKWVIWEAAPRCRALNIPGISLGPAIEPAMYVEYYDRLFTRSFLSIHAVECAQGQTIAWSEGVPVAVTHRTARGGIVVLGSMLGPNLYAGEPQAHQILMNVLRRTRQNDTCSRSPCER